MKCEVCSAEVKELRRGRCWGCYGRWTETRPVGVGAKCCVCGERRRNTLKSVELLGAFWPTCCNCEAEIAALDEIPQSMAGIRNALLDRERRRGDRRIGRGDKRELREERRAEERRTERRTQPWETLDGDLLVEEIARSSARRVTAVVPLDPELTRIHDLGWAEREASEPASLLDGPVDALDI